MNDHQTIDVLPDLTPAEMSSAGKLILTEYRTNDVGWDNYVAVNGSEPNALLHALYRFEAVEGATYDVFSSSYNDPYLLRIYDQFGNAIEANFEDDDPEDSPLNGVLYGEDVIWTWIAPYSGAYYVNASWHQGENERFYNLGIYEDIDTALSTNNIDRIFDWGEDNYTILFPDHPESQEVFGYHARLYSNGNGLGEKDGDIYFCDDGADSKPSRVVV